MTAKLRGSRIGLNARLFAAMSLVVVAGAATLLIVALLVAPNVFHAHLRMALGTIPAATQQHVDEAFTRAVLLSLAIAVLVATTAALTVTWLVSRRIAAPVADLAAAAQSLARGHTDTHVPDPGLGPEFAALAAGFNTMLPIERGMFDGEGPQRCQLAPLMLEQVLAGPLLPVAQGAP